MATRMARERSKATGEPSRSRRAYWRAQIAAQEASGLTAAAFCRQRGLRKGTLSFWRWKFAQEGRPRSHRPATFVPVRLRPAPAAPRVPPPAGELEIALAPGRGVRVRGRVEPTWLAQVLAIVAALRC